MPKQYTILEMVKEMLKETGKPTLAASISFVCIGNLLKNIL